MAIPLALFTLAGFLGHFSWLMDLTSHFRIQYTLLASLLCLLALWQKQYKLSLLLLFVLVINISMVAPYYWPASSRSGPPILRLLLMNVLYDNTASQPMLETIDRLKPDVLVIEELTPFWITSVYPKLKSQYPYSVYQARQDTFGIGIFSRKKLKNAKVASFCSHCQPSAMAEVTLRGEPVSIIAMHPIIPLSQAWFDQQKSQFQALTNLAGRQTQPLIVVGDFNTTPWSYPYRQTLARMRMTDTQTGFGLQPTWPAYAGLPWLPLDHCWVSKSFVTLDRKTGRLPGSDHYYLSVSLGWRNKQHK